MSKQKYSYNGIAEILGLTCEGDEVAYCGNYSTDSVDTINAVLAKQPSLLLCYGSISHAELEAAYPGIDGLLIMFTPAEKTEIEYLSMK